MSSTEIINKTGKALKLKVGNNLVFTDLTVVQSGASYKVHVDPNATYQEYLMGKDRNGRVLIISSDDCADNKSITIVEDDEGNYSTEKQSRAPAVAPPLSPTKSESRSIHRIPSRFSGLLKFFSFRSSSN